MGFASPLPAPPPTPKEDLAEECTCKPKSKKPKKRKKRTVCYKGTYYEGRSSLSKYPKEKISCQ